MVGAVAQMFEQALDAPKGWFHLSALDKSAPLEFSCGRVRITLTSITTASVLLPLSNTGSAFRLRAL